MRLGTSANIERAITNTREKSKQIERKVNYTFYENQQNYTISIV